MRNSTFYTFTSLGWPAPGSDLEKENAHILMQIRQQMDSEQLNKLDSQIAGLR